MELVRMAVSRALRRVVWRSRLDLALSIGEALGGVYLRMEVLGGRLGGLELVAGSVARPTSVSSARRNLSPNGEDSVPIY